jgi:hypothetical protein
VIRLLAWPRHRSVEDTPAFLRWSDQTWGATLAGPYLILDGEDGVLGTTGLDVETPWRAATGYVLRRDAWGVAWPPRSPSRWPGLRRSLE